LKGGAPALKKAATPQNKKGEQLALASDNPK
jgi:hypothetical protein